MRIKHLKLRGFKRFPFIQQKEIEFTFNSKLNIIEGINGSGKSSLLNELTPLPSDKLAFDKDGYKEICIEHNDHNYVLISDFANNQFLFFLDNENLNISLNVTTQKELVEKHFSINSNIHNLMVGIDNFTDMSVQQRRKLFSSITNLNIDSVLDGYNMLKEELKNNEVLLKNHLALLKAEESKLQNTNHIETIQKRLDSVKQFIDILLNMRNELYQYLNKGNIVDIYKNYSNTYNKILNIIKKYYIILTSYSSDSYYTFKSELEVTNFKLDTLYKLLEEEQSKLSILKANKNKSLDALIAELNNKSTLASNILSSLNYIEYNNDLNIMTLKNLVYKLEVSLPEVLNNLPLNHNKEYSKEKYEYLLKSKEEVLKNIQDVTNEEIAISSNINKLTNEKTIIQCPKCNYTWILNNIDKQIEELKQSLSSKLRYKVELQKRLQELNSSIEDIKNYFNLIKIYFSLRSETYKHFIAFWRYIDDNMLVYNDPKRILSELKNLNNDIIYIEEYRELSKQINTLKSNIENLKNMKNISELDIESKVLNIQEEIEDLFEHKKYLELAIENANKSIKIKNILNDMINKLKLLEEDIYKTNFSVTVGKIIEEIDNELSKNKITLIELEKELGNYNNIKYTVENYKRNVEDIKENIEVLNILLTELSPKDGLIAKYIGNFINVVLSNINRIISSIWEYDMKLTELELDKGDILDYKFKLTVGNNDLVVSDISRCSSGMKEIINLAFRITLYKLLGLKEYPLFLDEFGTKLDKIHKGKVLGLIGRLLNDSNFSQIFLISHIDNAVELLSNNSNVIRLS